MRHSKQPSFATWNDKLRDSLTHAQCKDGHESGSWYFANGDQSSRWGGRLYCTAMAAMTLEIYYRHMPICGAQASEWVPNTEDGSDSAEQ